MRLGYGLLVALAGISGGCTTAPTVVAFNGHDPIPLGTRDQVHDAFGLPIAVGTVDGNRFEEFQVQEGHDAVAWRNTASDFQPLEEFHIQGLGELGLIVVKDIGDIPAKGKNLVVMAQIEDVLHFRLFDENGIIVVDTDETKLPTRAGLIADLRKQVGNLWADHVITGEEHYQIITTVAEILSQIPPGSFELGMGKIRRLGSAFYLLTYSPEDNLGRQRVLRDQTLRFEYDQAGKVTKVYLNGEFLLSPTTKPGSTTTVSQENDRRGWVFFKVQSNIQAE